MTRYRTAVCSVLFVLAFGCANQPEDDVEILEDVEGVDGKADGDGWSRKVVDNNSQIWNGGAPGWGAGTSIAVRSDGQPIIAYYDASYLCGGGGFGTYQPDAVVTAKPDATGAWKRTIEACGNNHGYWPRLRIDSADRMHLLFGQGWSSGQQGTRYVRKDAAGVREVWNPYIHSDYMSTAPMALALDPADEPLLFVSNQFITLGTTTTKKAIFERSASRTFLERDSAGTLHFVGSPFVPEPNSPSTSVARMRYASLVNGTVTVEIPRTDYRAQALGLVVDSTDHPHLISWNQGGELWYSTRTTAGWTEEKIADNVTTAHAALTITDDDELLVVVPGRLFRRAAGATTFTASTASVLASYANISYATSYLSATVGPDDTLHVAFQMVGPTRSNRSAPAPVYHASLKL